jgi:hypothetical protein
VVTAYLHAITQAIGSEFVVECVANYLGSKPVYWAAAPGRIYPMDVVAWIKDPIQRQVDRILVAQVRGGSLLVPLKAQTSGAA